MSTHSSKTKYQYIGCQTYVKGTETVTRWYARVKRKYAGQMMDEREAAIAADTMLIQLGLKPVNILKQI